MLAKGNKRTKERKNEQDDDDEQNEKTNNKSLYSVRWNVGRAVGFLSFFFVLLWSYPILLVESSTVKNVPPIHHLVN